MSMMRSHILKSVVSQKHKNLDISRTKDREEVNRGLRIEVSIFFMLRLLLPCFVLLIKTQTLFKEFNSRRSVT